VIRYSGIVVYLDGREEPFETGMRGARAWEAYATRHDLPLNPTPDTTDRFPVYTWQLVIAHAALNVEAGVDTWGDDVDGVSEWEASDVPPTREARSVGA
jgi:hypothetical protein